MPRAPPGPRRLRALAAQVLPAGEGLNAPAGPLCALPTAGVAAVGPLSLQPRSLTPADIIFGCGPITQKYGGPEHSVVNAAVHAALSSGILEFDTAPLYGDSEDVLGAALAATPLGERAVVHTKAGKLIRRASASQRLVGLQGPTPWAPFAVPLADRVLIPDYSAEGMRISLEESLQRMGLRRCHSLRLHDPDSVEGAVVQALAPNGALAGLRQLRQQGLIDCVSLGMNAHRDHKVVTPSTGGLETTAWDSSIILSILRGVPEGTFDTVLLAYGWNLVSQDAWPVMHECHTRGIRVHVAGVFSGLHHVNAGSVPASWERGELRARRAAWRDLAAKHGVSLKAAAVAFAALPTCVEKLVLGMKAASEVAENLAAVAEAARVPPGLWTEARAAGLLSPELPALG